MVAWDGIFALDTTGSMARLPTDDDDTCNTYVHAAGATTYDRPAGGAPRSTCGKYTT